MTAPRRCGAARGAPPGRGDVDWARYLGVLEEVEYRGWLTLVREAGDNGVSEVGGGIAFLRQLAG